MVFMYMYCAVSDMLFGRGAGGPDTSSGNSSGALSRFFSADVLRQQLPHMPPTPQVVTVDEIERH